MTAEHHPLLASPNGALLDSAALVGEVIESTTVDFLAQA